MVALIHHLHSIKDVFMCKERHHLRSIKDVFMCKERHQPHPTPPQPTPVLPSIKDVYMCKEHHLRSVKDVFMWKERHHRRSIKDVFTRKERHQPHPTPPQPTPLWPPANGYNHGYIYTWVRWNRWWFTFYSYVIHHCEGFPSIKQETKSDFRSLIGFFWTSFG